MSREETKIINVIYKKDTKEILAVIGDIKEQIIRNDIGVKTYIDTEPVFTDYNGEIYLKDNAIIIQGGKPK